MPPGVGQNGCACEADRGAGQIENRLSPGPAAQRNQATLRRPERSIYRCFLTDLAGFTDICRAGPNCAERQGGEKTGLFRSVSRTGSAFADQGLLYTCPRSLVKIDGGLRHDIGGVTLAAREMILPVSAGCPVSVSACLLFSPGAS
jgi:hypothetical protein